MGPGYESYGSPAWTDSFCNSTFIFSIIEIGTKYKSEQRKNKTKTCQIYIYIYIMRSVVFIEQSMKMFAA